MKRANRGYSGARRREDAAVSEAFRHPALFYRGIDEYLTGTLSFIEEGLAADQVLAEYNRALPEPPRRPSTLIVDGRTLSQARAFANAEAHRAGLASDRVDDFEFA